MKPFVILMLLLLISGCATIKSTDSASMPTTVVEEHPADKTQPAEPAETAPSVSRPETPEISPLETPVSVAHAAAGAKAGSPRHVAKEAQTERKVAATAHTKNKGLRTEKPSPMAKLAAANDEKLLRVYVGMDRAMVDMIMKSAHNPAKREQITGRDGRIYEVLFYLNREPGKGKQVTERQMTPVIFKDKKVVAIGKFHLRKLRSSGNIERKKRGAPSS
jgi:hypothetical protein